MRTQPEERFKPAWWVWVLALLAVVVGVAAIVFGYMVSPLDTWLWLVVWFVTIGGLGFGVLLWSAAFRVAQARWTPVVNRLGHSAIGFLPLAYIALIVLLVGARTFMPWVEHHIPEKDFYLNIPFLWIRDLVMVGILSILNFVMVRWSLKTDRKVNEGGTVDARDHHRLTAISVVLVLFYVFTFSIIAYDLIMSLSPEWFSTMFAPYIWVTNAYASLAVLVLMGTLLRRPLGVVRYLENSRFNDLGNLMLGFSLFSMGLFFAQYLTIWYGNLHEETFFIIIRYFKTDWAYLGWTAFALGYALPFMLLQSRALKHNPALLSVVSALIILGIILERYVLVVPSLHPTLGLTPIPALGGLAFVGAFVLATLLFLGRYPAVSSAQDALRDVEHKLEAIT